MMMTHHRPCAHASLAPALFVFTAFASPVSAAPPSQQLTAIERAFRCPEAIADPQARAAADARFLKQVEAMAPRPTPQQIASLHQQLLLRHRCGAPATIKDAPDPTTAVQLWVLPAQSRVAISDDDFATMPPVNGEIAGSRACDRPILRQQTTSLDGGFVYQRVCRWATSDYIVQVRMSDGRRKGVTAGNSLAVIRTGPWRGMLLVAKHKYYGEGGSYDATWVVRPDGKEMFAVPNTDDGDEAKVQAWLQKNGWTAD